MRLSPVVALAVLAVLAPTTALAAKSKTTTTKPTTKTTTTAKPKLTPIDQITRRVPVGISEQNATMFSDPLFAPLGIRYARYVTPWNAATAPSSAAGQALDNWITAARAAHVSPLISFEHETTDKCPDSPCVLPTTTAYRAAFKAFHTRYPDVVAVSPWNEANHPSQPVYKKPATAAKYYEIVKSECPACQVIAADVLDTANMKAWLVSFVKAAPEARLWGMHNYGDTNRFRTSSLATYLAVTRGSLWLTETGAITAFTTAAGKVSFKKSASRADDAMTYLFGTLVPSSNRIKRVYVYNWGSTAANRWDSGLLDNTGKPRKVYTIVKSYTAPKGGAPATPVTATPTTPTTATPTTTTPSTTVTTVTGPTVTSVAPPTTPVPPAAAPAG